MLFSLIFILILIFMPGLSCRSDNSYKPSKHSAWAAASVQMEFGTFQSLTKCKKMFLRKTIHREEQFFSRFLCTLEYFTGHLLWFCLTSELFPFFFFFSLYNCQVIQKLKESVSRDEQLLVLLSRKHPSNLLGCLWRAAALWVITETLWK